METKTLTKFKKDFKLKIHKKKIASNPPPEVPKFIPVEPPFFPPSENPEEIPPDVPYSPIPENPSEIPPEVPVEPKSKKINVF